MILDDHTRDMIRLHDSAHKLSTSRATCDNWSPSRLTFRLHLNYTLMRYLASSRQFFGHCWSTSIERWLELGIPSQRNLSTPFVTRTLAECHQIVIRLQFSGRLRVRLVHWRWITGFPSVKQTDTSPTAVDVVICASISYREECPKSFSFLTNP